MLESVNTTLDWRECGIFSGVKTLKPMCEPPSSNDFPTTFQRLRNRFKDDPDAAGTEFSLHKVLAKSSCQEMYVRQYCERIQLPFASSASEFWETGLRQFEDRRNARA